MLRDTLDDPTIRFGLYWVGIVLVALMLLTVFFGLLFGYIELDAVNTALIGVGAVVTWLLSLATKYVPVPRSKAKQKAQK